MKPQSVAITLFAAWSILATPPVAAQRASELRLGITPPPTDTMTSHQPLRLSIPKSYWQEGAIIGGAAGWVAGYFFMDTFAPNASVPEKVIGGLGGAFVPAILGALIGGQFPKGGR